MPVTPHGGKLAGLGDMGGLWEWTSSPLEKVKGFKPMELYPAYSGMPVSTIMYGIEDSRAAADFYDDKHNIVLGGSWATHPRVAGRKTL